MQKCDAAECSKRAVDGPDAPDPRPCGRSGFPNPRRHALRRHTGGAVYLHAAELTLKHPASGEELTFPAPIGTDWMEPLHPAPSSFCSWPRSRSPALPGPPRGADRHRKTPMPFGLSMAQAMAGPAGMSIDWGISCFRRARARSRRRSARSWSDWPSAFSARGAYHKILTRQVRPRGPAEASPQLVLGEAAPERFTIRENGLQFRAELRGRLLRRSVPRPARQPPAPAHPPCCRGLPPAPSGHWRSAMGDAQHLRLHLRVLGLRGERPARGRPALTSRSDSSTGANATSLLNQLDPAEHEFLYGDAFDWLRRLAKKRRPST